MFQFQLLRLLSSCLNRNFLKQFHFLKPSDIFGRLLTEIAEIRQTGTSAKKVTLSDANEDVDKDSYKKILIAQVDLHADHTSFNTKH